VVGAFIGFKAIAKSFDSIVETGKEFTKQMGAVAAVSGLDIDTEEGQTQLSALTDKARYLGQITSKSAAEAGAAMEYLALAGFKTSQILEAVPAVLSLSSAAGLDLARSSDIASDLLTAFGKQVKDLPNAVDLFAKTTTTANTNLEQFYEAAKYIAPVSTSLGISMEETAAAIGIMADAGIKGSMAGTSLRGAMLRLAGPPAAAAKAIAELGIQIEDTATGNMLPLATITTQINKRFKELNVTSVKQADYMKDIFGVEAQTGMQLLVKSADSATKSLGQYTKELENSAGAAEKAAKARMDNLDGDITLYKSAVSELQITIYSGLEPALRSMTQTGTASIIALTDAIKFLADDFKILTAVIGFILTPVAVLWNVFTNLTKIVATFSYYITKYLIKGLVAGLYPVVDAFMTIKQATLEAFDPLIQIFAPIIAKISKFVATLLGLNTATGESRSFLIALATAARYTGLIIGSLLSIAIEGWVKLLIPLIELLGVGIVKLIEFGETVGFLASQVKSKLQPFFDGLGTGLAAALFPILGPIKDISLAISDLLGTVAGSAFGQNLVTTFEPVLSLFPSISPLISTFVSKIDSLGETFDSMASPVRVATAETTKLGQAGLLVGKYIGLAIDYAAKLVRDLVILFGQAYTVASKLFIAIGQSFGSLLAALTTVFTGEFDFSVMAESIRSNFTDLISYIGTLDWGVVAKRVLNVISAYFGYKALEPTLAFISTNISSTLGTAIAGGTLGIFDDVALQTGIAEAFKTVVKIIGSSLYEANNFIKDFEF